MDKRHWPGCLLWHGWLPALSGNGFRSPWATSSDDIASHKLKLVLGAYSDSLALRWDVDDRYDAGNVALTLSVHNDTSTDGSMVKYDVSLWSALLVLGCIRNTLLSFWRAGVVVLFLGLCKPSSDLSHGTLLSLCKLVLLFILVVTLLMSLYWTSLERSRRTQAFFCFSRMEIYSYLLKTCWCKKGVQSTRITKVKGHADDEMVRLIVVEQVDTGANDQADKAADLGRRHVGARVMDGRRVFSQACHIWYPILYDLLWVFISVAELS